MIHFTIRPLAFETRRPDLWIAECMGLRYLIIEEDAVSFRIDVTSPGFQHATKFEETLVGAKAWAEAYRNALLSDSIEAVHCEAK